MNNYSELFQEAKHRTTKFNLDLPAFNEEEEGCMLTREVLEMLPVLIYQNFGRISTDEVTGQCLHIHRKLSEIISLYFQKEIAYTLGYIKIHGEPYFYFDDVDIAKYLVSKVSVNQELRIHAWLTLPSMEIIDLSFPTTYAVINNHPNMIGACIIKHPKNLQHGMEYIPLLIGDDYLWKIGAIRN